MAKNFGTRMPANREGGGTTGQPTTQSGPVADKMRYDWDEHEMSATPDEMAAPNDMPAERRASAATSGPNMTRRIAVGIGGLALVGGAIFAASRLGLLDAILKPRQEEEPPKAPEPPKLPDKLSPGDYVVGTDMEPGLWVASNFSTNDKSNAYMTIMRGDTEFALKMPQDRQSATQWAGQAIMVNLKENDEVHTTGGIVAYGVADMPKRLLSDVPNLRAGLLAVGGDLTPGKWQVTPKKIAEEINLDTYESVYQDVNYYGRLTQILASIAKAQSMTEDDILNTLCGYITLTQEDVNALESPYLLADVPYMSDEVEEGDPYATSKVPILDQKGRPVGAQPTADTKQQQTEQPPSATEGEAQKKPQEEAQPTQQGQQQEQAPADPFNTAVYHKASETTPNDPFGGEAPPAEQTGRQEPKATEGTESPEQQTTTEPKTGETKETDGQATNDAFNQTPESKADGQTKTSDKKAESDATGIADPQLTTPQVIALMLTNANMMHHVLEPTEVELQDQTFVLPLLVDMQTSRQAT